MLKSLFLSKIPAQMADRNKSSGCFDFRYGSRGLSAISIVLMALFCLISAPVLSTNVTQYRFSIKYMGITVAAVEMTDQYDSNEGLVSIHARSTFMGRVLFPINNKYYTEYRENYLPEIYIKKIDQRGFAMEKTAYFNLEEGIVEIDTPENQRTIKAEYPQARDFFCSLLYLTNKINNDRVQTGKPPKDSESIIVYANDNYWKARYSFFETQDIKNTPADAYLIELTQVSENKYKRSDVLTNNLIKKDAEVTLWFSHQNRDLPVKAEFKGGPFSVFWHLEDK